jgi:hypothetical protein
VFHFIRALSTNPTSTPSVAVGQTCRFDKKDAGMLGVGDLYASLSTMAHFFTEPMAARAVVELFSIIIFD